MSKRRNKKGGGGGIPLNLGPKRSTSAAVRARTAAATERMEAGQEAARMAAERLAQQEAEPVRPSWFIRRDKLYAALPKWLQPREEPSPVKVVVQPTKPLGKRQCEKCRRYLPDQNFQDKGPCIRCRNQDRKRGRPVPFIQEDAQSTEVLVQCWRCHNVETQPRIRQCSLCGSRCEVLESR